VGSGTTIVFSFSAQQATLYWFDFSAPPPGDTLTIKTTLGSSVFTQTFTAAGSTPFSFNFTGPQTFTFAVTLSGIDPPMNFDVTSTAVTLPSPVSPVPAPIVGAGLPG